MNAITLTEEEWNKITVCNENGCLICGLGTSIKRVVMTEDENRLVYDYPNINNRILAESFIDFH